MKKKVLVLASTFPRWKNDSTPPFVYELEKRLADDFDIHVLAPHFTGAKKYEKISGLKIHRFRYFWPAKLQKLCYEGGILPNLKKNKLLYFQAACLIFFELLNAARIVKKEKIDLIHAHWIIPQGIVALIINKLFGIPYIVTSHGGDIYGLSGKSFTWFKKIVIKKTKTITVVSTAIKKEIENKLIKNTPIEVIPMGVDSKSFNPNKRDENIKKKYNITGPFLLFVGRLAEVKGVENLIYAMIDVVKEHPKAKLLIIGKGPLETKLINLMKKNKLDSNVKFLGAITYKNMPMYYATADIYISPSLNYKNHQEGFGLTLVEAGMSGCNLIAVNSGGIKDIIKNNKTGLLLNSSNPKLISKAIIKLIECPSLFNKKKIIKEFIRRFDFLYIYKNYKKIIY